MKSIAGARPRLDVRDLELVLALAGAGTTVKAASALHVTQSAVSRGLLVAEDKLGTRLFDRTTRGLIPTAAGERLIRGAGPLLAQLVELERQAEAPEPLRLRVRLACECYTAYRWLPSTLVALRDRIPGLEVTLGFEHTHAPVAGLLAGELDVALVTTSPVRAPLRELPLFSDEIVFVVAPTHPLAERAAIAPADLEHYPVITSSQTPEPERRWFLGRVFGKTRPRLEQLRFPLTEAMLDAARAGLGVAILSEWMALSHLAAGDLAIKRLRGRPLRRPWRIAFRREADAPARQLAAVLARAAPRVPQLRSA